MIALSLTAILLTFLFSFFVESARIEKKLDTARMAITMRGHLQTRLQAVLTALNRNATGNLYTQQIDKEKSASLISVFDNGIDPDPLFSGVVMGRIFLDEEKNLCLATWPFDKSKTRPWRKEILLPHVASFEFEFLGEMKATKEKFRPITANLAWYTAWSKSETAIPSLIRLTIYEEKRKEPLEFAFILPASEPLVTYVEKKA